METITVTIGRNVGDRPLPASVWNSFVSDTREAVERATSEVWAAAPTRSVWGDQREDAFVFYGPVTAPHAVSSLRITLAGLAAYYGQEAIGLSIGLSELVESVAVPGQAVPALVEQAA